MTFTLEQLENVAGNCFLLGLFIGVAFVIGVQWIVDQTLAEREQRKERP